MPGKGFFEKMLANGSDLARDIAPDASCYDDLAPEEMRQLVEQEQAKCLRQGDWEKPFEWMG